MVETALLMSNMQRHPEISRMLVGDYHHIADVTGELVVKDGKEQPVVVNFPVFVDNLGRIVSVLDYRPTTSLYFATLTEEVKSTIDIDSRRGAFVNSISTIVDSLAGEGDFEMTQLLPLLSFKNPSVNIVFYVKDVVVIDSEEMTKRNLDKNDILKAHSTTYSYVMSIVDKQFITSPEVLNLVSRGFSKIKKANVIGKITGLLSGRREDDFGGRSLMKRSNNPFDRNQFK